MWPVSFPKTPKGHSECPILFQTAQKVIGETFCKWKKGITEYPIYYKTGFSVFIIACFASNQEKRLRSKTNPWKNRSHLQNTFRFLESGNPEMWVNKQRSQAKNDSRSLDQGFPDNPLLGKPKPFSLPERNSKSCRNLLVDALNKRKERMWSLCAEKKLWKNLVEIQQKRLLITAMKKEEVAPCSLFINL